MTLIEPSDAAEPTALAPDPAALPDRAARAWTERMAVARREDDSYAVTSESGHTYRVDLRERSCSCPDHRIRGERCKHLRRVAIEITARRVAPPGHERARCDACGTVIFVGRESSPHRCRRCLLVAGDVVLDRETGDRLVVARVTDDRADERLVESTGETVAEYDRNEGYPDDDIVVEATYLSDAARSGKQRRYAFPRSRLDRTDAELVDPLDGQ